MSIPKVSVIIPAYNAQLTITKTLESVLVQSYPSLEIIVVNDGSTDQTLAILNDFGSKINLISTENKGVSYARNLGLKHATGTYIQYLDSDDLLLPDKIKLQVEVLETHRADVAYGDWQRFTEVKGELMIKETVIREIRGDIEIELFTDFWCPPAVLLYSKRITEQFKWNEKLPVIQDARYFLDAALFKGKFIYTSGIMAMYREGQQNSLSQRSEGAFVTDVYHNCKDVYEIWKPELFKQPKKKQAILDVLRYCINRLSVLKPALAEEAIGFLLQIEPNYIPKEKGFLRVLSQLAGYKNAERFAAIKRRIKG